MTFCQRKTKKEYFPETGELFSEIEYNRKGQEDGELRVYYKTGELKIIRYYRNGQLIDTTKRYNKNGDIIVKRYEKDGIDIFERYYENGKLLSKGSIRDTITEGWWSYYDDEGFLKKKVEYINSSPDLLINDSAYPNQIIYYDRKGNIIEDSSNYFTIRLIDTLLSDKLTIGSIHLIPQISKETDFYMVYFWSQDENGNKTPIDSTYGKNNRPAEFWIVPKKEGKYKLMGFISEKENFFKVNPTDTASIDVWERSKNLYFEKEYFVRNKNGINKRK